MVLSVTWFPEHRKSYGALYGCSKTMLQHTKRFIDKISDSGTALHPLLLPIVFAELERKRLFDALEFQQSEIYRRILTMEKRLVGGDGRETQRDEEKIAGALAADGREAAGLWMEASSLSSALESFRVQLGKMAEHSRWLSATYFAAGTAESGGTDDDAEERDIGSAVEGRLQEIMDECESKVRASNTLIKGMHLVMQMVRRQSRRLPPVPTSSPQKEGWVPGVNVNMSNKPAA